MTVVHCKKKLIPLAVEINRISKDTTFGGMQLLAGTTTNFTFQVGANSNQTIKFTMSIAFSISKMAAAARVTTSFVNGNANGINIKTVTGAQNVLGAVDKMIKVVDSKRADLGAVQNRLDSAVRNQSNIAENVSAARSRIRDADFATETANMTKQNILQQAASSVLSQANQRPQAALSLLG